MGEYENGLSIEEKIKIAEKSVSFFSKKADELVNKIDNSVGRRKHKFLGELQMMKRRLEVEIELLERFVSENE